MTSTMLVTRIGIALFGAVCVASCGARTDLTSASVRLGDFPAMAAQVYCNDAGHCCAEAGRQLDQATCVPTMEASFASALTPAAGAPGTPNTAIPERCLGAVTTAATQCRSWTVCPELLEAIQKHGAEGEPCTGTCGPASGTLACGGDGPNDHNASACFVSDGLFCNPTSGTCQRRAAIGQPCSDNIACESLRCDLSSMSCAAVLPVGSDCGHNVFGCGVDSVCEAGSMLCTSFSAQAGLHCVCTRTLPEGAACHDDRQCASSPCVDGRCQAPPIDPFGLLICSG
jgi:hypothetical protein